jgi:hypothetical protein
MRDYWDTFGGFPWTLSVFSVSLARLRVCNDQHNTPYGRDGLSRSQLVRGRSPLNYHYRYRDRPSIIYNKNIAMHRYDLHE